MFRLAALLALLIAMPLVGSAQEAVVLSDDPRAEGLTMTRVASELNFPMGMVELPDESILVATSPSDSGNFYASTGALVRLADSDGDGTLDDHRVLADGLPGSLVAIARMGDLIAVTSAEIGEEAIMFFRRGERWREALLPVEQIQFNFIGAIHQSYALAVRPHGDEDGAWDLVFNTGAAGNDTAGPNVRLTGIISGVIEPASLYMITIRVDGRAVEFGEPVQIASGLRNGTTLAFEPNSGDLWIGENGIDGIENPIVSFSADELDVIPADQIGQEVIDFGFPDSYVDYATGELVGKVEPAVAFLPLAGSEAEGVAGIAFAPESLGPGLAGGILAGFHGQFDLTGVANEENPVRWVDIETGEQLDLVSNDSTAIGHLDSMVAIEDGVYLADFCNASMTTATIGCGVIYLLAPSE
jgi:glucose/arabinose dehydrogenase